MTGAWERVDRPFMVIGIVHTWEIPPDFLLAMTRLHKRGLINYTFEHDKPWDMARNDIAKECLDSGAEWCFFIDSDVLPPPDALDRLLQHNQPIVGGLYWRRHPEIFPEAFRYVPGSQQFEPLKPQDVHLGLNEVDGIGAGCLLVHRRVFESLKDDVRKLKIGTHPAARELYEFFKWSVFDPPYCSEDLYFCDLARKKGWKVFVDALISCGHVLSSMTVKDGRFMWGPLETGQG